VAAASPSPAFCNVACADVQESIHLAHVASVLIDRNLHDNLNEFFTRPWQDHLRAAETRNHMEQIYLEKLGEQDYEHVKEVREWLVEHPMRGMLLAFLQAEDPYKV